MSEGNEQLCDYGNWDIYLIVVGGFVFGNSAYYCSFIMEVVGVSVIVHRNWIKSVN
jgi:hypothetical protein